MPDGSDVHLINEEGFALDAGWEVVQGPVGVRRNGSKLTFEGTIKAPWSVARSGAQPIISLPDEWTLPNPDYGAYFGGGAIAVGNAFNGALSATNHVGGVSLGLYVTDGPSGLYVLAPVPGAALRDTDTVALFLGSVEIELPPTAAVLA